jgi:phage-related baseplate assembly protein
MSAKEYIRIGKVSDVDYEGGRVKVIYEDKGSKDKGPLVSNWLEMPSGCYRMPTVGSMVSTLLQGNGVEHGICLGEYFSKANPPKESGEKVLYIDLFGEGFLRYKDKTLTIQAEKVKVECTELRIKGDLLVDGKIDCSGEVTPNAALPVEVSLSEKGEG